METCVICRNKFEAESPAVLFISGYGNKRYICPECESLLDKATSEESLEQESAKEKLLERANAMKEPEAFRVLTDILAGTTEELSAEEEAELEAVFEETKEETPAKEEEAPLWASILPVAVIAAFILFLVWFYFFK